MRISSVLLVAIATLTAPTAVAQTPRIVMEEMMVPSGEAGIEIYVRNKRPADKLVPAGAHPAICARRDLSLLDCVRFAAGWHVMDGLHRRARL